MNVTVTARCVACQNEREIVPGEVPEGEMPMCDKCFSPMVVVRATGVGNFTVNSQTSPAPARRGAEGGGAT